MEQKKYLVLRDFVQYPSGKLYHKGSIFESTTYSGNPYIKSMEKFGFISVATEKDIKDANRKARAYKLAKKRVEEWKHSI